MEDLICDVTYDGRYKDAIRGGSEAAYFCDYDSIQKRLKPIEEALGEEAAAAADGSSGVAAATAVGGASEAAASADAAGATAAASAAAASGNAADSADPFSAMEDHVRIRWTKYIARQIDTYIDLIVDSGSVQDLQLAIKDSKLATILGDPTGLVLFYI